jgi:L-arabinose isomerase
MNRYEAARIEIGRTFLQSETSRIYDTLRIYTAWSSYPTSRSATDAVGYGFAEGDWKTAALVRAMKVMGTGLAGGNSFMEDYTYHFEPSNAMVLGSHMLEICESIANDKPSCEIHP